MRHHAAEEFWARFDALPEHVQAVARQNFELLKLNPSHPSLHFKKVGKYRSARVGLRFRASGVEVEDGILWFWIGSHAEYDRLLG